MFRKVFLFYLVSILIIVSCNNPEKAFKEAEEINTIEAYQDFITNNSDSIWVNKAKNNNNKSKFNVLKGNSKEET